MYLLEISEPTFPLNARHISFNITNPTKSVHTIIQLLSRKEMMKE